MTRRRIEVVELGDKTVVNFVDKKILDEQNIQMIGDDLFRLVDELGRRKVVLNFQNVEFMSSMCFGKILTLHRKLNANQGDLVLCNIDKAILDVFKITKLDKAVNIWPDEQSALQVVGTKQRYTGGGPMSSSGGGKPSDDQLESDDTPNSHGEFGGGFRERGEQHR
jgi:anti-sigma B factor antagonist